MGRLRCCRFRLHRHVLLVYAPVRTLCLAIAALLTARYSKLRAQVQMIEEADSMETNIGKSARRLDYQSKITGRALYLADMHMPGMCHGKILRSPLPHARIKNIDISKALKVPGILTIITGEHIIQDRGIEPYYGPVFKDQTIVAVEKVRHVGDPVAAVAAASVDAAEEALRLMEVDYEELPAVLD